MTDKTTTQLKGFSGRGRHFLLFSMLSFLPMLGWGQIASSGLNNSVAAPFSVSGGAYYTGNSASVDGPASSPYAIEGTHSYGVTNGTAIISTTDINTSSFANISLTFRLATFSLGSATNGADAGDNVKVEISPDGGVTYYNTLQVNGNSNAYWSYAATGTASTPYDGNTTPVTVAPAAGGSRTSDGYSTITVTNIPSVATLRVRITALNNSANERWVIDDIILTGTPATSNPSVAISSPGPAAGTVAPSATDVLVYALNLNVINGPVTLSGINLSTTGTFQASDLGSTIRLFYSTDAVYDATDGPAIASTPAVGASNILNFGSLNQTLNSGNANFILVVTDIAATPVNGRTIGIDQVNSGAVSISTANTTVSGTGTAGNFKTIVVPSPEINVKQNTTSIATGGSYAFASTGIGNTTDVTFTIENLGTANLNLNAASFTGTAYSMQTNFTSPVAASGSTTFVVRFAPTAIGANAGSISIPNNDADENPYVINFTGTGTSSNLTDLVANGSFTYSSNIDYTLHSVSSITNTSQGVGVFGITVREGGAAGDPDNLPTIINSISFTSVAGATSILNAALFNGNALVSNTPTIGASTITFSGLTFSVADNSSQNLTLRVTFKQTAGAVTDNQQLSFTVANTGITTASSTTSSGFTTTSLTSSTTGNINRLVVTATTTAFGTQPSDGEPAVNLSPFTIRAVDANGNLDLDQSSCQVNLTTSGTGFTSTSPYTFSSGLITIYNAQYSSAQTGVTITATAQGCLGNTAVTSSAFSINSIGAVSGDYRSTGAGTIGQSGIWEQFNGSAWVSISGAPPTSTTSQIFIKHAISTGGSVTYNRIVVISGGTFTIGQASTVNTLLRVREGGVLQINANLNIGSTGTFQVDDNGTVNVNFAFGTPATSIWNGTENFAAGSNFVFQNWDSADDLITTNTVINTNTINGYTAAFGNLVFDFGATSVNQLDLLSTGVTINLAHGNMEFRSIASGNSIRPTSSGTQTSGINGNFIVASTYPGIVQMKSSGTLTFTIGGNYQQSAGTVRFTSATSGTVVMNINGNMTISGGTTDIATAITTSPISTTNLKGNLIVGASGTLVTNNTSGADAGNITFNFTGITPQQVNVASTVTNIPFRVLSGATVQLANNLTVNRSTIAFIVRTGGTLDFSSSNGTPFTFSGTSGFTQEAGATLKITSPLGIDASGATGNVLSTASGRNFNNAGIYHYTGTVAQVTGTGLNAAAGQKVIIIDNPTTVTLSQLVNIATTGGGIDIRQGTFQGSPTAYVAVASSTNSVDLTMAAGTVYRFTALTSTLNPNNPVLPQSGGNWNLAPTSIIELSGAGDQQLRGTFGSSKTYGSITFAGGGTKTLSSNASNVAGTVTINGATTIVDVQTNALGGSTTNFTMTDGRFRTARTTDTQPNMDGTYNLTGGVVEFYGTTAATTQTIRGAKTYFNVEIGADAANTTTHNVLHGNGNVTVGGEFRIKSPAVYQIGSTNFIVGTTATAGTFVMEAGSTLKYGDTNGITLQSCGTGATCGSIRTPFRTFPADASYGFINSSAMVTGNGLPASVVNLYLQKSTAATTVTLTNPLTVTEVAALTTGTFIIGNNLLTLNGTVTGSGNGTITGSTTSNIVINGSGSFGTLYFTAGGRQLQSLTVNRSSGTAYLGTDLAIENLLTLTAGTLGINGNTVTLNGSLSAAAGAFLGSQTSNLVINGTGPLGADLTFSGSATLANLTLNRPGSKIVLGSGLSVFNALNFTAGLLQTAATRLLVFQDNATHAGAGLSSHIIGPVVKVGDDAFIFPLGTDTLYAPMGISAPAGVTESFRADYLFANPNTVLSSTYTNPVERVSAREYWQLLQQSGSSNVAVTLSWSNGRSGGVDDLATLLVARLNGSSWASQGRAATSGTLALGTITSDPVTGYGFFSLASGNINTNPLPVELISFTGAWKAGQVELSWATVTEVNAASFEVERSLNGTEYATIGQVKAAGNTQHRTDYAFTDTKPAAGLSYYRLKQIDVDGTFRYLGPVAVRAGKATAGALTVYPNPVAATANLQFELSADEPVTVRVLNVAGALQLQQTLSGRSGLNTQALEVQQLAKGIYLLELHTSAGRSTFKLVKD